MDCLEAQINAKKDTHKRNRDNAKTSATILRATISNSLQHAMDLAQEKGASSWLTSLLLEEFSFTLHKSAFRDAIAFRYGCQPLHIPTTCACGTNFPVEHVPSCPKGGFPTVQHNEVRDLTAFLMSEVCHNMCVEPTLQPITGEALLGTSAITEDGARLDVAASGFWGGCFQRAFFDVKIFYPNAPSNRQPLSLLQKTREHQEMSLQTKSLRSRAQLLHPPCHVSHWRSRKHCHSLLQEACLAAILQMGLALK